jgi:hypothetical protein
VVGRVSLADKSVGASGQSGLLQFLPGTEDDDGRSLVGGMQIGQQGRDRRPRQVPVQQYEIRVGIPDSSQQLLSIPSLAHYKKPRFLPEEHLEGQACGSLAVSDHNTHRAWFLIHEQ